MRMLTNTLRRLALLPAIVAAGLLAGCAGGGVELEGPGFESLGLTGKKKKGEPKVPDRAPLLMPPDRARLPQPRQSTAAAPPQNWPNDPGDVQKAEAAEAKRIDQAYRDSGNFDPKADIDEFEKLMDPMERRPGVFGGDGLGDKNRDAKSYGN